MSERRPMYSERAIHDRSRHAVTRAVDPSGPLDVGDDVEVFSGYEHTWSTGFSVAEVLQGNRYRLRRGSDGALLPDATGGSDLRRRPEARR
jgi:hypothetical protein